MFGTGHPQPPHRKEVAMQIVQHRQRALDKTLTVEPPDGPVALPPPRDAFRVDVACTLAEYLAMLRDHVAFLLRQAPPAARLRNTLGPLAVAIVAAAAAWLAGPGTLATALACAAIAALCCLPFTTPAWVLLFGTPIFLLKRRRTPSYSLRIDAHGIERSSHAGTLARSWDEVRMVRRYSQGYMLVFGRGALPIPFRCMDGGQQQVFRALALGR